MGKSKKSKKDTGDRQMIKKPSFESPFSVAWPEIEKDVNKRIIDELRSEIPKHLLGRKLSKCRENDTAKSEGNHEKTNEKVKQSYNEFLLLGINAVTKALEKGPLSLVLVCKSVKQINISHHLIPLCVMQNTDASCVAGLSNVICNALGLQSVLAVGFKMKQGNPLDDLICFIKDKVPCLHVPWLDVWQNENTKVEVMESASTENRSKVVEDSKHRDEDEKNINTNDKLSPNEADLDLETEKPRYVEHSSDMINKKTGSAKKINRKRKLNEVKYELFKTNYKITEVPKPMKK